jgi:hypothetical protein
VSPIKGIDGRGKKREPDPKPITIFSIGIFSMSTQTAPQFTLRRRSFLAGGSALALAAVTWPKPILAQAADLGGRDPKTLVVLVDATVGNLDPATNVEWAYGLRPVYETRPCWTGPIP